MRQTDEPGMCLVLQNQTSKMLNIIILSQINHFPPTTSLISFPKVSRVEFNFSDPTCLIGHNNPRTAAVVVGGSGGGFVFQFGQNAKVTATYNLIQSLFILIYFPGINPRKLLVLSLSCESFDKHVTIGINFLAVLKRGLRGGWWGGWRWGKSPPYILLKWLLINWIRGRKNFIALFRIRSYTL